MIFAMAGLWSEFVAVFWVEDSCIGIISYQNIVYLISERSSSRLVRFEVGYVDI